MILPHNSQKGMTLIEVLVAGVISTIVAGAMVVVWKTYDDRIRTSATDGTLQMQHSEVAGQIGCYARQAHRILENYHAPANDSCRTDSCRFTDSLFFYDGNGSAFAAIYLNGDRLFQHDFIAGTDVPFTTGSGEVLVDTAASLPFAMNGCRNAVLVNMTLVQFDKDTLRFTPGPEEFRCRN